MDKENNFRKAWAKLLHPESLRTNLITGALFLVIYETLREVIRERLHSFFWSGFDADGPTYDPEYQTEVLDRHKSPYRASLLWLRENNVVDDADLALFDRVIEHRRQVAHQMLKFLAKADETIDLSLLQEMVALICKIERWWIIEFEMQVSPDVTPEMRQNVIKEEVASARMIVLQLILQIAFAEGDEAMRYYDHFMQAEAT